MSLQLTTERLILRPFVPEDADDVWPLANNWRVASMLGRVPFPYAKEDAEAFIARTSEHAEGDGNHVFALTEAGTLMGACGIHLRESALYEIGYWLGEPFWGRGLATEAVHRLVRFAFDEMQVETMIAGHFFDNPASARVLSKAGFRYTGDEERICVARGIKILCHVMAQTRAEHRERRASQSRAIA